MRGQFRDAAASYEKAIAANDTFAAAHRNYAVLLDLYLGDPERALTELERYKELTGEDKPVTGWIAELRQRTGKPAAPRPAATPAPPAGGSAQPAADGAPAEVGTDGSGPPPASPQSPPPQPGEPPAQPQKPAAEAPQPRLGTRSERGAVYATAQVAAGIFAVRTEQSANSQGAS
jgi:hypothetical protein